MATSVFSFSGVLDTDAELKRGYLETTFDPPSNIAGKTCYVECTYWIYDNSTSPTPALTSRDAFVFTVSWAQSVSGTVTENTTRIGRVPMAGFNNNMCYSCGPVLCFVPNGPHPVEFTVFRPDDGTIGGGTTSNIFYAVLKIVPADSRQPQIGV